MNLKIIELKPGVAGISLELTLDEVAALISVLNQAPKTAITKRQRTFNPIFIGTKLKQYLTFLKDKANV